MAAVFDSLILAKSFLQMLMPSVRTITDPDAHAFLRRLSRESMDTGTLEALYANIPYLPHEKAKTLRFTGNAGSYGQFALRAIDSRRCFKVVKYSNPSTTVPDNIWKSGIFKELFIQYLIAEDGLFGPTVPMIYNIYRAIQGTTPSIVIEMSYGTSTVFNYLSTLPRITFSTFYEITKTAFTLLQKLHARFGFVHRDFKLNNLLLRASAGGAAAGGGGGGGAAAAGYSIQIIDFGMACINVHAGGINYAIKATGHETYMFDLPCREQQDVITYLLFYMDYFAPRSEKRIIDFIRDFIPEDVMSTLAARIETSGKPGAFKKAYNKTGSLLLEDDLEELTIEKLLSALDTIRGGRRRCRQTRRRLKGRTIRR
jgi:serine/threonine protein kinase